MIYEHYKVSGVSEARRANSGLRTENIADKLEVVLKPDGAESKLYPHSLHSLFEYDGKASLIDRYHIDLARLISRCDPTTATERVRLALPASARAKHEPLHDAHR